MSVEYHKAFTNIHKGVVKLLKDDVIKAGFFRSYDETDKLILLGLFNEKVADLYGMPKPFIQLIDGKEGRKMYKDWGGGMYYPASNIIFLHKHVSLVSYLHEFRHAMQWQVPEKVKLFKNDMEHDAVGWSLSLYHLAAPRSYANAVRKGLINHVNEA